MRVCCVSQCQDVMANPYSEYANNPFSWCLNEMRVKGCICSRHRSAPQIKLHQQKLKGETCCSRMNALRNSCPGHNSVQELDNIFKAVLQK